MENSDKTQKKLSDVIIDASSRLNNIVTEFLDFARPQKPNFQDCYLEEIIDKNLDFLSPELDKEKIIVNHNLDDKSFKLEADPHLLYRAFLNIFINAIQSMNGGGTITINVEKKKDHYSVEIEDTGIGIREDAMSKVFNPFFSTKDKGSGLGLPIVRNIVEAHNGDIWIKSRTGSGTKVMINLPGE